MSGIAGIIAQKPVRENKYKLDYLLSRISHRGKKRKMFKAKNSWIGINSNYGTQINLDDCIVLLDGKIYNLDAIAQKYNFEDIEKESSDIKKISSLFDRFGENIFEELKGSFALAILDGKGNSYLTRDVIGKKPLYYSIKDESLLFASEMKSLIEFTREIKEFPPGTYIKNFQAPKTIKKIDADNYNILGNADKPFLEERLKDHLLNSMDKRIGSNFSTFGVWLSGGLDSSIVTALLKEFKEKIYTFSVGFKDSPDLNSARIVSEYLGTEHREYKLNVDELFSNIPEAIYYLESFDAPLVRSSLGNMIASELSSAVDVVFSGEGGDELFAGYNYFFDFDSSRIVQEELVNAINSLHNTALQRVDRAANAFGVDVKLPLLDESLINFGMQIPPDKKVIKDKGISKYVLRKVASKYLPESITWRKKDKFWEGSGIGGLLSLKVDSIISTREFEKNKKLENGFELRNKEEFYYYKIFKDYYKNTNVEDVLSFTQDFN